MDSFTFNKIEFGEIRRVLSEFCSCSLGRDLSRRISPSRNPDVITKWLSQVTQMQAAIQLAGLPPFGGVVDIAGQLERSKPGGGASGEDYAAVAGTLQGAANIKKYLDSLASEFDRLHELSGGIGDFASEVAAIWSIIGPDGAVKDSASMRLTEIRAKIGETARHIHDVIYGYLRDPEVAKLLQNAVVTLHGDRYVLPVKQENRGRLKGVVHRESNSGATVFVEPNQSVELNNLLSDLCQDERNEIQRLLNQLAIRVSARHDDISDTLRMLAQVDMISAKAQYSYQFNMTPPEVYERGPLVFNQARHPLLIDQIRQQELAGIPAEHRHVVVPIDVRLGDDFDVLVVTGSNTGGKTVALKTVASLVLMAQSGMHIPAKAGARMPVFHDVFIDIGDEQSLQQSLSTFGAHIKRIKYLLHKTTKSSLVLLDELGSGTDPDEGGAIGQAILDELRGIGCLGMVTTHLSVLKAYAFSNERIDNASVEFNTETLTPTYRLIIGQPGESHAITVAHKLGLPRRIVSAARGHLSGQGKQFRKAIAATNAVRLSAEAARAEAQAAQVEARSQQEVYQSKLADLHRLQAEFETWLARIPELKAGDEVYVPSLKKTGRLVRLELHRQIALVDADNFEVEVPLKELMPDLGQVEVRQQIAALRQQILDQARATEEARAHAQRIQDEYRRSLHQQKERARQFDAWLGAIAHIKPGDEVPIDRKPGRAKLTKVDLPGLRVTVEVDGQGEVELPIQDIFPQTGPFAHLPRYSAPPHRPQRMQAAAQGDQVQVQQGRPQQGRPQQGRPGQQRPPGRQPLRQGQQVGQQRPQPEHHEPPPPEPNRPMYRRDPESKAAQASKQVLLSLEPGKQVFVVPFNKRATLIRINADKDQAVVQSGIFEMEIPLADLEPVAEPPDLRKDKGKPRPKPAGEHQREPQAQPHSEAPQPQPPAALSPPQAAEPPPPASEEEDLKKGQTT